MKNLNKPYGAALFMLFTLFVSLIGYASAQEDGVIGKSTTTSEPFQSKTTEDSSIDNQDSIAGVVYDHFVYLPFVSKTFMLPEEEAVLILINAERARVGCGPLTAHPQLTRAARDHSADMAHNDYFDHISLDGRTPWQRMAEAGYTSYSSAGENIAAWYPTPADAVEAWMNSEGHRNNILNCNFTETGIGYYYLQNDYGNVNYHRYWTQNFARP